VIIENANEGIDTVHSSISWTLGTNLENLTLTGTAAINGKGNELDNILIGNSAKNTLEGGAGNDTLDGGAGVDKLIGGTGDDTYVVDLIVKGTGSKTTVALQDTIIEAAKAGNDTVILRGEFATGLTTTLKLHPNVENLDASLTGSTKLNLTGNASDNMIYGNAANNIINGGAGNDTLDGGEGNDILIGGAGADTMTGGAGADIFRFLSLKDLGLGEGKQDIITDFEVGVDKLDFKALKGFSFKGTEAFTGTKQLRYETDGQDLILYVNSSGDSNADFSIKLVGITSLSSTDLLLV
jgi:serralysin